MTHHFLRAAQLTPSEIQFRQRHQEARARINAAGDAYARRLSEVVAHQSEIKRAEKTEKLAETLEVIREESPIPIAIRDRIGAIQRITCEAFEITLAELKSSRRKRHLVMARQVGMYLCKKFTSQSFPYIGQRFGGRDHSTVLYACDRIEEVVTMAPTDSHTRWCAADCQVAREKVASLTKSYFEMFGAEG